MFRDEEFAMLYCPDNGRDSAPPSLPSTALLLQAHDTLSDEELRRQVEANAEGGFGGAMLEMGAFNLDETEEDTEAVSIPVSAQLTADDSVDRVPGMVFYSLTGWLPLASLDFESVLTTKVPLEGCSVAFSRKWTDADDEVPFSVGGVEKQWVA